MADRGFTGHEHLPSVFGLIDMNGRMYDPVIGRFLSPDPYVQAPDYAQNFNRYGYALNNPLIYTDPSGEFIVELITILSMAYLGGVQSNISQADNPFNPGDWNWSSPSTYIGIGTGALGGAGMAGFQVPTLFPNLDGMMTRGVYQAVVNVGINGISNTIIGDPFLENWGGVALSGFTSGALTGYSLADANGKNLWWGAGIGYNRTKWSFFNSDVPDYTIDFKTPNVGSSLANDCVPTTFIEVETKRGGSRTYDDFIDITKYKEGIGVSTTGEDYKKLINSTFGNVQALSRKDYNILFDANYMQNAANNNEMFSFSFSNHADNVRKLQVFTRASYKNKLVFRQSQYNCTPTNCNQKIWNIFKFY